ncbi:MAG: putative Modification methylase, HemK family [Candidatus Saccharibacteria bacterium]|nr:putative Modification methylase, HemK family [Candidatus Saccharibacteria bacterium]
MRIDTYITETATKLNQAGIGTARLDALVLLEDCLGKDRAHLLAHPEIVITSEQLKKLNAQIRRRLEHEPLAYIRGRTEFYGREFTVNKNVLEPRPESETMIDLLKKLSKSDNNTVQLSSQSRLRIADIGSGSGCLGVTAALELELKQVAFYDIDAETLRVAKENARRHNIDAKYHESDLLSKDFGPYDIILANLPYVPDNFHINQAAMREPNIAIFGGQDGLDLYRKLFMQLRGLDWKPAYLFTEALPPQHEKLAEIALLSGFELKQSDDFIQVFTSTTSNISAG